MPLLYSARMNTPNAPLFPAWPTLLTIVSAIVSHTAVWSAICAVGALGSYRDQTGLATHDYGHFLLRWLAYHVPMMMLSCGLSLADRKSTRLNSSHWE